MLSKNSVEGNLQPVKMLPADQMGQVHEGVNGSQDVPHGALALQWRIRHSHVFSDSTFVFLVCGGVPQHTDNCAVLLDLCVPSAK
jgi:hypothetical protein